MDTNPEALREAIRNIRFRATAVRTADGVVCFEGQHETQASADLAESIARALIPWRKGPFKLGDLLLDAEWRSDKKWDRLQTALPSLKDKIVADVGCNNGYYLYRIAEAAVQKVIGFDPTYKYELQYELLRAHAPELPIEFRREGWQALAQISGYFDVIFLMGVNYHDAEPLNMFAACKGALKSGGLLICESVTIPYAGDLEIFPSGKYAGIGGVYAIPTSSALQRQLRFAGFKDVDVQHSVVMTVDEQRRSEFSPQKSLAEALQVNSHSTEGYPPLTRAAIFAYK